MTEAGIVIALIVAAIALTIISDHFDHKPPTGGVGAP